MSVLIDCQRQPASTKLPLILLRWEQIWPEDGETEQKSLTGAVPGPRSGTFS